VPVHQRDLLAEAGPRSVLFDDEAQPVSHGPCCGHTLRCWVVVRRGRSHRVVCLEGSTQRRHVIADLREVTNVVPPDGNEASLDQFGDRERVVANHPHRDRAATPHARCSRGTGFDRGHPTLLLAARAYTPWWRRKRHAKGVHLVQPRNRPQR
jgi:hypothetical protein